MAGAGAGMILVPHCNFLEPLSIPCAHQMFSGRRYLRTINAGDPEWIWVISRLGFRFLLLEKNCISDFDAVWPHSSYSVFVLLLAGL